MAKKEQKKPSKKPQPKEAVKAKKAAAPAKKVTKKTAAPVKKPASQAQKAAAPAKKATAPPKKTIDPVKKLAASDKKAAAPRPAKTTKFFSVAEFADMTYLTENGVMLWLKQGLLKGHQNEKGDWQVEASNLEVPNVKRLVR
jgi:hypothetical protein